MRWEQVFAGVGAATGVASLVWTALGHRLQLRNRVETGAKADEALDTARRTGQSLARLAEEITAVRKVAEESTEVARAAAGAAARSADEAARMSSLRVEQEHRDLEPAVVRWRVGLDGTSAPGVRSLTGTLTVSRNCRVSAVAMIGATSRWSLGLPLLLRANRSHKVEIEKWPPDRNTPQATDVLLKLWPPTKGDVGIYWECPCGRPLEPGRDDDPGHWEHRLPVEYHPLVVR